MVSKYRKDKKLSLEKLGLLIGVDRSVIHRIENGKNLTLATLVKLCLALDKRPQDFFTMDFNFESEELSGFIKAVGISKKKPKKSTPKKAAKKRQG